MAKVALSDLPIRVFRAIDGGGYLALIEAGTIRFTFTAPGALEAKRKARDFVANHEKKATK